MLIATRSKKVYVKPNSGSTNLALRLRNTANFCKDDMLKTTTEMRMCNGREPPRTKTEHITSGCHEKENVGMFRAMWKYEMNRIHQNICGNDDGGEALDESLG